MFKKSRLRTGLSPDTLRKTLTRQISEDGAAGSTFHGRMGEDDFEVRRVNAYRSSYLPLTRGRIVDRPEGAELELSFRPNRQVVIFLSIWLTFLLLVSLLIVVSSLTAGPPRLLLLTAPLGLAALSWILTVRVFSSDCRWVAKALEETLRIDI